jgi:mono/diheme cytochrome c family protein
MERHVKYLVRNLVRYGVFSLVLAVLAALGIGILAYSGIYDIGADVPHSRIGLLLITTLRERSIQHQALAIAPPPLGDPRAIAEGAEHYAAMCADCHLAPGMRDTELRSGLYPLPPKLFEPTGMTAAEQFWVVKHGIKFTAMPAWGGTHDDQEIWNIVAFLQAFPGMPAQQYTSMTAYAVGDHHHH